MSFTNCYREIENDMRYSIIIPTFNAQYYIPALLPLLQKVREAGNEVIVVDSSSTDKTFELLKNDVDNFHVIDQHDFEHGTTRNIGISLSSGSCLVFMTQDALPCSLEDIVRLVEIIESDENVGAAYGKQLPYSTTGAFGKHLRLFNYKDHSYKYTKEDIPKFGIKTAFLSNSFSVYKRVALEGVGCFQSGLILGEDTYAAAKMILKGYSIAYSSEAKCYHSHDYTLVQEFKRYFDIGVFHTQAKSILSMFGGASGEGLRFVKSELRYLLINRHFFLLPHFLLRNGMKFIGYKLGMRHKYIPTSISKLLSMHRTWWSRKT